MDDGMVCGAHEKKRGKEKKVWNKSGERTMTVWCARSITKQKLKWTREKKSHENEFTLECENSWHIVQLHLTLEVRGRQMGEREREIDNSSIVCVVFLSSECASIVIVSRQKTEHRNEWPLNPFSWIYYKFFYIFEYRARNKHYSAPHLRMYHCSVWEWLVRVRWYFD